MGSTVKEEHLRWFGRTIPYVIDSSVENLRRFIEGDTTTRGALQILQEQTHLRFVVRDIAAIPSGGNDTDGMVAGKTSS